jgi:hypothetical protein
MRLVAITALLLLFVTASVASAVECGDVDQSGSVGSTDALRLLRVATGAAERLYCPCTPPPPPPSDGDPVGDCFGDPACSEPTPYCDGYVCSECSKDEHCSENWACDHGLHRCTPWSGFECGDVDWDGVVAASDALRVLRIAVGRMGSLRCPPCGTSSTSTT